METKFKEKFLPLATIAIEIISIILVFLSFGKVVEFELAILFLGMSQAFTGLNYLIKDDVNKFEKTIGDYSIVLGLLIIFLAILKSVM